MASISYTKNSNSNFYTKGLNAEAENTLLKKTNAPKAEAKVSLAEAGYNNKKSGLTGSVKLGGAGVSVGSTTGAEIYTMKYEGSMEKKIGGTNVKIGGEASFASVGVELEFKISKKGIKAGFSTSLGMGFGLNFEVSR